MSFFKVFIFAEVLKYVSNSHALGKRYFFCFVQAYISSDGMAVIGGFFYALILELSYLFNSKVNDLHSRLASIGASLGKEQRGRKLKGLRCVPKTQDDDAILYNDELIHISPEGLQIPFRRDISTTYQFKAENK